MLNFDSRRLFFVALLSCVGFSMQATAGNCILNSGNFNLKPGQNEFFSPDTVLKIAVVCDGNSNLTALDVTGYSKKWGWGPTRRHYCQNNNSCLWNVGNVGSNDWPEAVYITDQNNVKFELKMQSSVFWDYVRN